MSFFRVRVLTRVLSSTLKVQARKLWTPSDGRDVGQLVKKVTKKKLPHERQLTKHYLEVVAFCTAQEYNLENLKQSMVRDGVYDSHKLSEDLEDDVLYIKSKYDASKTKEIYFFRDGSVVFWNVPTIERYQVFDALKPSEIKPYDKQLVQDEKEELDCELVSTKTRIRQGVIQLQADNPEILIEKYTFSNVLTLSVKLAMWEASLETYIESIKPIVEDMVSGNTVKLTRDQVFRKTGELFTLRHYINLSSDLLDTPDFYWERENLEKLYKETCNLLNIQKRTRVMNEKLNHCCELMELLSAHLNDKHHVRLEWMIIVLIMVEVAFELLHYIEQRFNSAETNHIEVAR